MSDAQLDSIVDEITRRVQARLGSETQAAAQQCCRLGPGQNPSQNSCHDCGGCHAHSQQPLAFESTATADPTYQVWDLVNTTPLVTHDGGGDPEVVTSNSGVVNIEFYQDIRPIL